MKLKSIVSLCKEKKHVGIYQAAECQWLSDGNGIYPLWGVPHLTQEVFCELFDITKKQSAKLLFIEKDIPEKLPVFNNYEGESYCEPLEIFISFGGDLLMPLKTQQGIVYIKKKYLAPLADCEDGAVYFFERGSGTDMMICVKSGLEVVALIYPENHIFTEFFCDTLEELSKFSKVKMFNLKEGK